MPTSLSYTPSWVEGLHKIYKEGEALPLLTWVFVPLRHGVRSRQEEYVYTTFQISTQVGHSNIRVGDCWEIKDHCERLGFVPSSLVGEFGDIVQLVFCDIKPVPNNTVGIWLFVQA